MKRLLPIVLLLLAHPAAADVYRCELQGKTVYQDRPCPDHSGGPLILPPISVVPAPSSTVAPAPAAAPVDSGSAPSAAPAPTPLSLTPAEVRAAIIGNRVLRGMKAEEVLAAAERHTDHRVEGGSDVEGPYELWVFSQRLSTFPFVVKLRNGVVVETRGR